MHLRSQITLPRQPTKASQCKHFPTADPRQAATYAQPWGPVQAYIHPQLHGSDRAADQMFMSSAKIANEAAVAAAAPLVAKSAFGSPGWPPDGEPSTGTSSMPCA